MGLFDSVFGGGGADEAKGIINSAVAAGESSVNTGIARSRAERSVILASINRQISEAKILGRYSSRMEDAGAFSALRNRAAGERRQAEAAGGIGGPGAIRLSAADRNFLATAMDASQTADLRRRQTTMQYVQQLTGQAGQITTAGSSAELSAITGLAGARIDAATRLSQSIMEAESQKFAAITGAIGMGIGGYFAGGTGEAAA